MIKIDTLQVMSGHVPREVIGDLGIITYIVTLGVAAIFVVRLAEVVNYWRANRYAFRLSLVNIIIYCALAVGCMNLAFFFTSGFHSMQDLFPCSNRSVVVELDVSSKDLVGTVGDFKSIQNLIQNFPKQEQRHLDKEIFIKDGKCFFKTLFSKKELKRILDSNELEKAISEQAIGYIKTMKLCSK